MDQAKEKNKTTVSMAFSGSSLGDLKRKILYEVSDWNWEDLDFVFFSIAKDGVVSLKCEFPRDVKLQFDVMAGADIAIDDFEDQGEHIRSGLLSLLERTKAAIEKIDNYVDGKKGE